MAARIRSGVEAFGLNVNGIGPQINRALHSKCRLAYFHNEATVNVGPNYSNIGLGGVGLYSKGSASGSSLTTKKSTLV